MPTNDVNGTLDTTSLVTTKGRVVQLRKIKNCRLAEKFLQLTTGSVKTMVKCLDSQNDTMDETDTRALQYLSLPETC